MSLNALIRIEPIIKGLHFGSPSRNGRVARYLLHSVAVVFDCTCNPFLIFLPSETTETKEDPISYEKK